MDEFNYCLAQIVAESDPNMEISEWKYQCLFEKLLHLFGIYTWWVLQIHINCKPGQLLFAMVLFCYLLSIIGPWWLIIMKIWEKKYQRHFMIRLKWEIYICKDQTLTNLLENFSNRNTCWFTGIHLYWLSMRATRDLLDLNIAQNLKWRDTYINLQTPSWRSNKSYVAHLLRSNEFNELWHSSQTFF